MDDVQARNLKPFMRLLLHGAWKNEVRLRDVLGDDGNLKIPRTTAIFNMASAHDCPSRKLGLCKAVVDGKHICYAIRSETTYHPYVEPYRNKQKDYWLSVNAHEFCIEFLAICVTKAKPFTALRFNEAGDFHTQECVDKAEKIARILKPYGIICYCYTSRDDLDFHRLEALKVSGSGFKKPGIVNVFKVIACKEDKPKGYGICPMDCHSCDRCLKSGLKTAIVKH